MPQVKTGKLAKQPMPHDHANHLCSYHEADQATVAAAIEGALAAKQEWEAMPWNDRAAIFLKAADLVSGKYRYKLMAATMLGQGKNAWQAEIDAAAEVASLGIAPERAADYVADGRGTGVLYDAMACAVAEVRACPSSAAMGDTWRAGLDADVRERRR